MHYKAPAPEDIERLKKELGYNGTQMAKLFGVADHRAFRRYTSPSGTNRREISAHMLFFAMARLELSAESIERVLDRMRRTGAEIALGDPGKPPEPDGEPQP
jgi:hypothetical protein